MAVEARPREKSRIVILAGRGVRSMLRKGGGVKTGGARAFYTFFR